MSKSRPKRKIDGQGFKAATEKLRNHQSFNKAKPFSRVEHFLIKKCAATQMIHALQFNSSMPSSTVIHLSDQITRASDAAGMLCSSSIVTQESRIIFILRPPTCDFKLGWMSSFKRNEDCNSASYLRGESSFYLFSWTAEHEKEGRSVDCVASSFN